MFGNKSWLCAGTSSVEWDAAVAGPEVRQTGQSAWRHVCRSVGRHGGPVEPDRYFSFVQTRTEPLPLTYVPATVQHGWLDSGYGCGRCARARRAQCRRVYHDPVIGPSDGNYRARPRWPEYRFPRYV